MWLALPPLTACRFDYPCVGATSQSWERICKRRGGFPPYPMRVVHSLAVVNAHYTERKLHTLEYRLSRLYTWPQQGKERGKSKKLWCTCATLAPYLAASSLRSSFATPL